MNTNKGPLVSIITPVLNGEKYIKVCLESVLSQTYPDIEHIFVDGGSKDHTLEILDDYIRRYPSRIRYITGKDNGVGSAVNKGFKEAKGDIYGWIDTDDFYNPEAVAAAVEFFDTNRSAMLVFGGCDIVDENGKPFVGWPVHATHYREQDGEPRLTFTIKPYDVYESLNDWQYIVFCATFYRRHLISAIGGFNDLGNDLDFWLRVNKHFRMWPLPDKILTNWRLHNDSISMKAGARESGIRDNRLKEDFFLALRYGGSIRAARAARYYPVLLRGISRKLRPFLGWSYPLIMKCMHFSVRNIDRITGIVNSIPGIIRSVPDWLMNMVIESFLSVTSIPMGILRTIRKILGYITQS